MSVDKIFEALSSAPRRRILAYLSKTDMTAGEIARASPTHVATGDLQAPLGAGERRHRVAREARPECPLRAQGDALTASLVHFLAKVCPRSRPYRKDSAEAAKRKKQRT